MTCSHGNLVSMFRHTISAFHCSVCKVDTHGVVRYNLSVNCNLLMASSRYFGFVHQENWLPSLNQHLLKTTYFPCFFHLVCIPYMQSKHTFQCFCLQNRKLMFNIDHLGCKLKYGRKHFFRLWRRYSTHQNKTACLRRLRKQHIFITSFR